MDAKGQYEFGGQVSAKFEKYCEYCMICVQLALTINIIESAYV